MYGWALTCIFLFEGRQRIAVKFGGISEIWQHTELTLHCFGDSEAAGLWVTWWPGAQAQQLNSKTQWRGDHVRKTLPHAHTQKYLCTLLLCVCVFLRQWEVCLNWTSEQGRGEGWGGPLHLIQNRLVERVLFSLRYSERIKANILPWWQKWLDQITDIFIETICPYLQTCNLQTYKNTKDFNDIDMN